MAPLRLRSVRARLTLYNVAVLAAVALALGGALRLVVARNLMASIDNELVERARRHQAFWLEHVEPVWPNVPGGPHGRSDRRHADGPPRGPFPGPPQGPGWREKVTESLYNSSAGRFMPGDGAAPRDLSAFRAAMRGRPTLRTLESPGSRVRIYMAPLGSPGRVRGAAEIAYTLDDVDRTIADLNRTLLTLAPVALLVAALGGLLLTGRMLRPVRAAAQEAGRIGAEDLSARLTVSGSDEFAELATTVNGLLERLEHAFEQQKRFTADASHELRTPLSIIKANAGLALSRAGTSASRKELEAIDRASSAMGRIIQDLLLLSRCDAGRLDLERTPVRVSDVVVAAADSVRRPGCPQADTTGVAVDLWVDADASRLTRLIANLIDNAARYTAEAGTVTVEAVREGADVVILVRDTGPGIAPEHLARVCERFYRADESRAREHGGVGLGLAIAKAIAEAHGGRLTIASTVGVGTTAEVRLPSCPEPERPAT